MTDIKGKVGIGITTYNRPEYFKQCFDHVISTITSADILIVYNDGSTVDYSDVLATIASYPEVPFERVVFIDKKEYEGDLFSLLESTEAFIKNHLHLKGEIKGLQRTDTYEIPPEAIREDAIIVA